jgi:hypothetical protein
MGVPMENPGSYQTALEAAIRDLLPSYCGCKVKKAADQLTANYSAGAAVAWDAEVEDVGDWHDNVTNNTRLIVPSGRKISRVKFSFCVRTTNNTIGAQAILRIDKGGLYDTATPETRFYAPNASAEFSITSLSVPAVAGNYFESWFLCSDASLTFAASSFFAVEATHFEGAD